MVPQVEHWRRLAADTTRVLPRALDWLDRGRLPTVEDGPPSRGSAARPPSVRAVVPVGGGTEQPRPHEAEIRHLSAALARACPVEGHRDEITVLVGGDRRTLTIDVGERIRSGEG